MVRRIQERAVMEDVRDGEKGEEGCERGRAGKGGRRRKGDQMRRGKT